MIYHVSQNGNDNNTGEISSPFKTINRAAAAAQPGDTVQVHDGTYREWVDPPAGGLNDNARITFEAAPGEHPVIKGSEIIEGWKLKEGTVWEKVIPNSFFGDYNPYKEKIEGDWLEAPTEYSVHTGDVYINGKSMYEAASTDDLYKAEKRVVCCQNPWKIAEEKILHPEDTVYRWYASVDENNTTLLCNFQDIDPNSAAIEINVRKCCFFPRKTGINYITVRGFEMAHAATPFNPPTAEQIGMVGPHWSKGWIIENNRLHDAKTSAVSIGAKEICGNSLSTEYGKKSGHRYQNEVVFAALLDGWDKEAVGSHTIRNNVIYDCGENGIVGNLGGAFCKIEHNHIYNIAVKHEFFGHEIAGIKLHAAIDTVIENNNIHNCALGIWLDWEAQGTRVTRNLFYENVRDIMIEVTHGPCLVDNNILLSDYAFDNHAQGTALVHNFIAGITWNRAIPHRATPYHFTHSTQVKGFAPVYSGDDRLYNNIFTGRLPDFAEPADRYLNFCTAYEGYTLPEEYDAKLRENYPIHDLRCYTSTPQPVWIAENTYTGHAKPWSNENGAVTFGNLPCTLKEKGGKWTLELFVCEALSDAKCKKVTGERLGTPRLTEQPFENPDGTPVDISYDITGKARGAKSSPGPFETLKCGNQSITVWEE